MRVETIEQRSAKNAARSLVQVTCHTDEGLHLVLRDGLGLRRLIVLSQPDDVVVAKVVEVEFIVDLGPAVQHALDVRKGRLPRYVGLRGRTTDGVSTFATWSPRQMRTIRCV